MTNQRVLSVGQCGADHWGISRTLQKAFCAEVVAAHTAAEALEQLRSAPFALVLVNRVFDADGSSGTDFIRQMREDESLKPVPVMLVSNYEDAQAEAVAAGALPGFGKAALGQPHMLGRVAPYLPREGS
jgi:two-component system chemotaxis response regulator CheY